MLISSLVLELRQLLFVDDLTRTPEIGNSSVWVLHNVWRLWWVRDTKFGANISNKNLINAAKCQVYSFCRFWLIEEKPIEGGKKKPPLQIRVKKLDVKTNPNLANKNHGTELSTIDHAVSKWDPKVTFDFNHGLTGCEILSSHMFLKLKMLLKIFS